MPIQQEALIRFGPMPARAPEVETGLGFRHPQCWPHPCKPGRLAGRLWPVRWNRRQRREQSWWRAEGGYYPENWQSGVGCKKETENFKWDYGCGGVCDGVVENWQSGKAAEIDGPPTTGAQLRDLTLCGLEAAQSHNLMWAWGNDHRGSILN